MPFRLPNAVHETTTTSGTGPLTLLGAVTDRKTFGSQLSNGDTTMIVITDGTDWECAVGTFTSPSTISRDTVIYSTNGNALVNWPASGTRDVFIATAGEVFAGLVDPGMANGLMCKTADRTYAGRTLAAGHGISISNPAGTAGNPTISQTVVPAGTVMVFYQAAAPTGWTQVTTHNDKALRVVNGVGGGVGGTHNLSSPPTTVHTHGDTFSVDNHVLLLSQIPSHSHVFYPSANVSFLTTLSGTLAFSSGGAAVATLNETQASGGSGGHNHGLSGSVQSAGPTAFAPAYIDVILCSKDA